VTNYTGDAREYLKKLIHTMGGTFTASMSQKNTAVVAALYASCRLTFSLYAILKDARSVTAAPRQKRL
jgi:hypothetical protein